MSLNGISTLATKQLRQIGKLDLAASDRAADGNPRAFYDITQLPTQYSGNDILDNSNTGGLIEGRPWIAVSYSIGTIPSSINEGVAGTINVTTVGVADGTTLYWTINNVTTSNSDFTATSGSFTITSNAGSFTITPTADITTEGAETFTVQIRTGSTSGTVVATTSSITVNDTSITSPFVQSSLVFNLLTAPSSGSTWTEDTNNGYNGTVYKTGTGSATYTSSNGGGLTLGPSNATNMAMIGTTYTLPTTNWSVEMVVDTQPTGYWAALFGSDQYSGSLGHLAYWGSSTGNNFYAGKPGAFNIYAVSGIPAAGLKHIVVTVAAGTLKVYKDGTLLTPTTTGYTAASSTGSALQFGSRHPNAGTANTPFDATPGTYYQMRVYSKALSQAEVTTNYTASKTYTSGLP
jgi:hypothetical protein